MDRPLGDCIAKLFFSLLGKCLRAFRIIPCIMTVVKVNACKFRYESFKLFRYDGAIGTSVTCCHECIWYKSVAENIIGALLTHGDRFNSMS